MSTIGLVYATLYTEIKTCRVVLKNNDFQKISKNCVALIIVVLVWPLYHKFAPYNYSLNHDWVHQMWSFDGFLISSKSHARGTDRWTDAVQRLLRPRDGRITLDSRLQRLRIAYSLKTGPAAMHATKIQSFLNHSNLAWIYLTNSLE